MQFTDVLSPVISNSLEADPGGEGLATCANKDRVIKVGYKPGRSRQPSLDIPDLCCNYRNGSPGELSDYFAVNLIG